MRHAVLSAGQSVVIMDENGEARDPNYPYTYTLRERKFHHGHFCWSIVELPDGVWIQARRLQVV